MEFVRENDVVVAAKNVTESAHEDHGATENTRAAAAAAAKPPPINSEKEKKKRSAFGIFSAALFMLRKQYPGEKDEKKTLVKQKSTVSNANWKKLVGSIRPLCLPQPPQSDRESMEEMTPTRKQLSSRSIEETVQPGSPAASSSSGTMSSKYASATSLQDLCNSSGNEEDPDEVFDAICGDEMIDAKAEEFIAQFYKEIHIQNTTSGSYHDERGT